MSKNSRPQAGKKTSFRFAASHHANSPTHRSRFSKGNQPSQSQRGTIGGGGAIRARHRCESPAGGRQCAPRARRAIWRAETPRGSAPRHRCRDSRRKKARGCGNEKSHRSLARECARICAAQPAEKLVGKKRAGRPSRRAVRSVPARRHLRAGRHRAARLDGDHDLHVCTGSGRAGDRCHDAARRGRLGERRAAPRARFRGRDGDLQNWRRAGRRGACIRHGRHRAGAEDFRPRQRLRRRGEAAGVWPRGHRPSPWPERNPCPRRRGRERRLDRRRPARAGRARQGQPDRFCDQLRETPRCGAARNRRPARTTQPPDASLGRARK